ncbi:dihydrolipoamide acetyltransferase family protein [Microbacterium sp. B2969]|uniref:Dihydrolipoamide acetyltransferase component of pyruvate dehydrogenase complex n=1 Tax=Microbacterium alkaliflavum TaxID=3248839 RepID=A0ABW7Q5S3_9MICO
MAEFRMPSLGADMEQGKVVEWLVKPGDYVHRGDVIAEVDTEKTVMEVETFDEGVVAEFLVELGDVVPVGTPLAVITATPADGAHVGPRADAAPRAPEAPSPAAASSAPAPPSPRSPTGTGAPAAPTVSVTPPVRRLAHDLGVDLNRLHGSGAHGAITRADVEAAAAPKTASAPPPGSVSAIEAEAGARARSSPRARRLAERLGVDLTRVRGTGPGGAVTSLDVERAGSEIAESSAPAPPAPSRQTAPLAPSMQTEPPAPFMQTEPMQTKPPATPQGERARRAAGMRRAVGALMARSKREIPHYYLSTTIDLSAASEWMQRQNAGRAIAERLVPAALLLSATAKAAKDVPDMNGFFLDGAFQPSAAVHLGVAVALRGGGLIAPAIHDADQLTADALMERLRDLVSRARAGRLQRGEMADPTITVTNLGDLGVETIFGVIYPPQVALVGFGRVLDRPVAQNGLIGVRPSVVATLSADHRASDGLAGGRLLARIDELLQKPEEL